MLVLKLVGYTLLAIGVFAHLVLLLREVLGFRGSLNVRVSTEGSLLFLFASGALGGPLLLRLGGETEYGWVALAANYFVLQGAVVAVLALIIAVADLPVTRAAAGSQNLVSASLEGAVIGGILLIAVNQLRALTFIGWILLAIALVAAIFTILRAAFGVIVSNPGRLTFTAVLGFILGLGLLFLPEGLVSLTRRLPFA